MQDSVYVTKICRRRTLHELLIYCIPYFSSHSNSAYGIPGLPLTILYTTCLHLVFLPPVYGRIQLLVHTSVCAIVLNVLPAMSVPICPLPMAVTREFVQLR